MVTMFPCVSSICKGTSDFTVLRHAAGQRMVTVEASASWQARATEETSRPPAIAANSVSSAAKPRNERQ